MKYILIIGDGMADIHLDELSGNTPLMEAETPTMDYLAKHGLLGSTINCPGTLPPGSDTAILTIFGCDPLKYYFGRAPLEAAAQGIRLSDGDLAFRCNMVTLEEGNLCLHARKIVSHSSGSIDGESSRELVEYLFTHPEFAPVAKKAGVDIYPTLSYRHIAVQTSGDSKNLVLTPPHDHLGEICASNLPKGNANASVLTELIELSFNVLSKHPINEKRRSEGKLPCNCIWFWAEGTAASLPSFEELYSKKGAVISAVPLCHGIGALMNMDMVHVEGATGDINTNYEGKAEAAFRTLMNGADFVAIHVEAPDECTHDGDVEGKVNSIAYLDRRTIAPLIKALSEENTDYRILVLSDHKTLSTTLGHDASPVPFILYDSRELTPGSGMSYNEDNGLKGEFIRSGLLLMEMLFSQ